MTVPLDSQLLTEIGKPAIKPGLYVAIEGVPYFFGSAAPATGTVPLVYGAGKTYGAQPSGSDAGTIYKYGDSVVETAINVRRLKAPTGFEAVATPEQGDASFGGAEIRLQDCPELRFVIANYPLKNKKIEVFAGVANVPAAQWAQVYTGKINRRDQWDDYLGWTLQAIDITRTTKNDIFALLQTELTAQLLAGTTASMAVSDSSAFPSASGASPNPAQYLLRIDDEVISYETNSGTGFATLARGLLGTVAADHASGSKVTELLVLRGHPLDLARYILLSTGLGTNTGGGTNYDVLPERHGLGIEWPFIDINSTRGTSFESAKTELSVSDSYEFRIAEKENGRRWLTEQIYKTCNCLPIVYGDGREGVAVFSPPEPSDDLFVFDPSVIIAGTAHVTNNDDKTYNECRWRYDHDPIKNRFVGLTNYRDDASVAAVGVLPMPFDSKGLRSSFSGETIAITRSQRFLTRFATAPIEIEASGTMATLPVEVGDLVIFSSRLMKDPKTGEQGVGPVTVQVTGKTMDFERLSMKFRFQYAFANFKYGRIPPYGTPNYSSATPEQKATYVFAADPLLPDGSEPYRLG